MNTILIPVTSLLHSKTDTNYNMNFMFGRLCVKTNSTAILNNVALTFKVFPVCIKDSFSFLVQYNYCSLI